MKNLIEKFLFFLWKIKTRCGWVWWFFEHRFTHHGCGIEFYVLAIFSSVNDAHNVFFHGPPSEGGKRNLIFARKLTKSLCNSLLMYGLIFIKPMKMKKQPRRIDRPINKKTRWTQVETRNFRSQLDFHSLFNTIEVIFKSRKFFFHCFH